MKPLPRESDSHLEPFRLFHLRSLVSAITIIIIMALTFDTTPPGVNDFTFRGSDHLVVVPAANPLYKCEYLPHLMAGYPLGANDSCGLPLRVLSHLFMHIFKPTGDVLELEFLGHYVSPARYSRLFDDLAGGGLDFASCANLNSLAAAVDAMVATWELRDHRRTLSMVDLEGVQERAIDRRAQQAAAAAKGESQTVAKLR